MPAVQCCSSSDNTTSPWWAWLASAAFADQLAMVLLAEEYLQAGASYSARAAHHGRVEVRQAQCWEAHLEGCAVAGREPHSRPTLRATEWDQPDDGFSPPSPGDAVTNDGQASFEPRSNGLGIQTLRLYSGPSCRLRYSRGRRKARRGPASGADICAGIVLAAPSARLGRECPISQRDHLRFVTVFKQR
ncbi:hypothetical protein MRX96_007119 [Rhipicephalus microplus]